VTTVTTGTSVITDVEGGDVVLASEAVIETEVVEDVLSDALSEGKAGADVAVLGGVGMGTAAENPIDEQRSKAVQRLIK